MSERRPTMLRMATRAEIGAQEAGAPDRIVTVACSTETLGRDDIVIASDAFDLTNYRRNPIVLFQHNPDWPIARAEEIGVIDGNLVARVRFPDPGVSPRADEVYGLIRAGIVNAASTGFEAHDAEPLDPADPRGAMRITAAELQEFSFVSIPAVPDALVTERALQETRRTMKLSNARMIAAKSTLTKRGLYDVGRLAYLLDELGWVKYSAEWEAEVEQDGSTVPAQIGEALQALGAALVAMTAEEVAELVGCMIPDQEADPADPIEVEIVTQATSPAIARFRLGMHRAGRRAQARTTPPTTTVALPKGRAARRHLAALYERQIKI